MACTGNKVLLHWVLWKIQSLSVVQKSNTRQEVSFKERQPRKAVLQTSAAKQGPVQTAIANRSPVEANSKTKVEVQGSKLQQLEGMILGGNEQEQERMVKAVAITVDVWIWTGNTDPV